MVNEQQQELVNAGASGAASGGTLRRAPTETITHTNSAGLKRRVTIIKHVDSPEADQHAESVRDVQDLSEGSNIATIESAALGVACYAGVKYGTMHSAYMRSLPISFKALMISGPAVGWWLWSSVASSRGQASDRVRVVSHDDAKNKTFTQAADLSKHRQGMQLSLPSRISMWGNDHPLQMGVTAAAPIVTYAAWANYKHPGLTLTQRISRTSVAAQVSLLASLGGIVAFSTWYESRMPQEARSTLRKHMTTRRQPTNGEPATAAGDR